ncbi:amidohydrolase [Streptomyces purpureus]|uniref:amidohydrolase n=1 Tax=Streptomyces purpureus TaxID=1951 RepID=UPI003799ABA0
MNAAESATSSQATARARVLRPLSGLRGGLAEVYRVLHAHPELSFAEHRTARAVAAHLERLGMRVTTGLGGTGVAGVLANGDGPTVLLRADMDALPVHERTGLPYASTVDGAMHACGHDMHVTCLLGALELLALGTDAWSGTVIGVFQPGEEVGGGAKAMVDDGLFEKTGRPDAVLGQHLAPLPAGTIGYHAGPALAATDALHVRMFGRGGHASRPETAVDPVVMAASTVMRLQTVVSREIAGNETAVLTVGALHAGSKDNVIPDEAELEISIRTYTEDVRRTVLAAVERIVKGEAAVAGAEREPEITPLDSYPVLVNDEAATARTVAAFRDHFGAAAVIDTGPVTGSEDCGIFATAAGAPLCYWFFGGWDPEAYAAAAATGTTARDIPSNHSPYFGPVLEPALTTGVTAMTVAALTALAGEA